MTSDTIDEALPGGGRLQGFCAPAFQGVLDEYRINFARRGEVGSSVCLTHEGETVVDLWGGIADRDTGRPWERDTVCVLFSCTKGAAALVANMLVERGKVSLDDDVAGIWPEFSQNGKAGTTLAMMLSHAAPVPGLRDPVRPGGLFDWDYMVERVAAEPAWWVPGTQQGYHALTYAWTVGHVVRLAAGRPLGRYFQEEIAGPLGIDFWIGLPEEHEHRVAPLIMPKPAEMDMESPYVKALFEPGTQTNVIMTNSGATNFNAREAHAAEIASGNGITNARGLAGMYAPLANGGGGFVSEDTIARMSRVVSASHRDTTLLQPMRFGLGFMLSTSDPRTGEGAIIGERAFGHAGSGGSYGLADPEAKISFGYAMNRGGVGGLLDDRGQSLIDAAYRGLGWRSRASGAWRR